MRGLPFHLALSAYGLLFHHRHSGPVDLHIQNGNRLSDDDRQVQLHGPLNVGLLAGGNIFPDGLGRALHRLGGHFQIRQEFHLLPPLLERDLLADDGLHAAHTGRELRVFNVQFDIGGELSAVAVRAQVIRARNVGLAHGSEQRFGAQFLIDGRMAARARDAPLLGRRNGELQQLAERPGTGVMEG